MLNKTFKRILAASPAPTGDLRRMFLDAQRIEAQHKKKRLADDVLKELKAVKL